MEPVAHYGIRKNEKDFRVEVKWTNGKINFINKIKPKALGQEIIRSTSPGQMVVKIVNDELISLLGSESSDLNLNAVPPVSMMMVGLQGSGKTTFSGKLAHYLKNKKQKNPILVACDVYRPAAIDQLETVADQVGSSLYVDRDEKNPIKIAKAGLEKAKKDKNDIVIIDTAGRLAIDEVLMNEIKSIHTAVNPSETLFVVDSMTGQDAVNTAKAFNSVLDYNGVVLTKLDGDTRGGAALTIKSIVNKPIKFIGNGEKLDAIDIFYPERMADRILGMGDVVSLVERAQDVYDEKKARELSKKIAKNIRRPQLKFVILFISLISPLALILTTFSLNHKIFFFQGEKYELLRPFHLLASIRYYLFLLSYNFEFHYF